VLDQLFSYGSQTLDRVAFQKALDEIGAEEGAGTDFSVKTLAEDFERGVELLADNELRPALPDTAFEIVRRQVAETVAGRLKSPDYIAGRALHAALFPKGDPTLRQALPETVSALTLADLRDYYRRAIRPDLTTIVVIGKVTPEGARQVIEKHFGGWSATGAKPETRLPPVPLNQPGATAVPDASRVQDRVTLAETLGLTRADPDYYALELGNRVLGGGFYATRLYRDLRKESGLVYSVDSYFDVNQTRGLYFVQYACDPRNVARVHGVVARELRAMQAAPVTAQELELAKALALRELPLDEADVDGVARGLLERSTLDLPLDEPTIAARRYIALSAAEVQAAFAKWIRPDDLVRVSQGPPPH
jgi:zinc protease